MNNSLKLNYLENSKKLINKYLGKRMKNMHTFKYTMPKIKKKSFVRVCQYLGSKTSYVPTENLYSVQINIGKVAIKNSLTNSDCEMSIEVLLCPDSPLNNTHSDIL